MRSIAIEELHRSVFDPTADVSVCTPSVQRRNFVKKPSPKNSLGKPQAVPVDIASQARFPTHAQQFNTTFALTQHNGSWPAASEIKAWQEMIPNAAERYMAMVEREQGYDHSDGTRIFEAIRSERSRGQWMTFVLALSALIVAGFCAFIGATGVAAAIGTTTVVGLATVFAIDRFSIVPAPEIPAPKKKK